MQVSVLTVRDISMPVRDKNHQSIQQKGFTLIESVVGIVIFGFSMILLATTVFPMFAQSPDALYESRASALGQAVMSKVNAAQFDKANDPSGSRWRCGENAQALAAQGIRAPGFIPRCSLNVKSSAQDGALAVVDDYIGCWSQTEKSCQSDYRGPISQLIGSGPYGSEMIDYSQFIVEISVAYDTNTFADNTMTEQQFKRIDVAVLTPKNGRYDFTTYRSNY